MNITLLGKEIALKEDQYLIAADTGKIVLRNHFLAELMRILNLPEPVVNIVPEGTDPKASIYLVKATLKIKDGISFEEYGEANPRNLKNDIAKEYPFSMARSRAINRVILKALGVSGKVLGEDEVDKSGVKKPEDVPKEKTKAAPKTAAKTTAPKEEPKKDPTPTSPESPQMTKEEAGEVEMHFGTNKGKKVKDFNKYNVDFALKVKQDNDANIRLAAATRLYHGK